MVASCNIMANKSCVVGCCSNYEGKIQLLVWIRSVDRGYRQLSFINEGLLNTISVFFY